MATIDCKAIAKKLREEIKVDIEKATEKYGEKPFLEIVQVGAHPSSVSYVKSIIKTCDNMNVNHKFSQYDENITEDELVAEIEKLNADSSVHGVIVQYPLPAHIDSDRIANVLSPAKDVDCVTSENLGKLLMGIKGMVPCTPKGMMRILKESGVDLVGKDVVVVGNGRTVGRPITQLLLQQNATVTVCHSKTKDLAAHLSNADVVVGAAGRAGLIPGAAVKEGVVVIDAAINVLEDGSIVGDAEFDAVSEKASLITPVPGGVGTTTNAMLMENLLELFLDVKTK
ncbi:bifunctional protein FolD protein [Andreesenia angusta]|uniref:Bifunctional protein FolD n=1 Tax=Andreesenia angusta TaxID=39480 RepID=A0A1S1V742_9FIRM|nr:bifunctional 5,10-methylenetetrahydrofolate dehydrogenase/5,10-methenyltetrahydrofolate cyclohydrolase [Andreesenia angusta]OHW61957.1 bifunctional protein FolD protein [Andreesenia angusta]